MKKYANPTLELLQLEAEDVLSTLNSIPQGEGPSIDFSSLIEKL